MIALPTNGALISREEFEALHDEVMAGGSAREKGMMRQMDAMLLGFAAIKREYERERHCRMEAERAEGELVVALRKVQKIVQARTKKARKAELDGLLETVASAVEEALEE